MRRTFLGLTCTLLALGAAAACASSDAEPEDMSPPDGGEGGTTLLDGAADDGRIPPDGAAPDAPGAEPCSADGWCETPLPDVDLQLVDVWPTLDRAFAVGNSNSRGQKVLEWGAPKGWSYIDDATQNAVRGQIANVWAPSAAEVYFTLNDVGVFYGESDEYAVYVYHGIRPVSPATSWSWTRQRIGCNQMSAALLPYVGGTSKDDVYLTFCGNVYRRGSVATDAGTDAGVDEAAWVLDYTDDDAVNPWQVMGLTGTASDDVWFVGVRGPYPGACTVVVRKTAAGYERVADSTPLPDKTCAEKPGSLVVQGAIREGSFHSPARGRFLGVGYATSGFGNEIVSIAETSGGYDVSSAAPPAALPMRVERLWGDSDRDVWLLGQGPGGNNAGRIIRGTNVWSDAGVYEYSTLVRNGAPNLQSLFQLRGASNTNLWAVGVQRAFHKTTP
jgi:hypothetical protein